MDGDKRFVYMVGSTRGDLALGGVSAASIPNLRAIDHGISWFKRSSFREEDLPFYSSVTPVQRLNKVQNVQVPNEGGWHALACNRMPKSRIPAA